MRWWRASLGLARAMALAMSAACAGDNPQFVAEGGEEGKTTGEQPTTGAAQTGDDLVTSGPMPTSGKDTGDDFGSTTGVVECAPDRSPLVVTHLNDGGLDCDEIPGRHALITPHAQGLDVRRCSGVMHTCDDCPVQEIIEIDPPWARPTDKNLESVCGHIELRKTNSGGPGCRFEKLVITDDMGQFVYMLADVDPRYVSVFATLGVSLGSEECVAAVDNPTCAAVPGRGEFGLKFSGLGELGDEELLVAPEETAAAFIEGLDVDITTVRGDVDEDCGQKHQYVIQLP